MERAGHTIKWMCESDKFCNKILVKRWPDIPIHKDARELDNILLVDCLIGGFPCQPVSNAGPKNGVDDSKWLWPAYDRAIRIVRPPIVVVENVLGLFSRGFGDVLRSLALQGYDAEWFSLQSSEIGAPHRRNRVFILATDPSRKGFWEVRAETLREQEEIGREKNDNLTDGSSEGELQTASLADTISGRFKKRQQGWKLQQLESFNQTPSDADSAYEYRRMARWKGRGSEFADGYFGAYDTAIRRWEQLIGPPPDAKDDQGRLSPYFVEWMLGFPEGWTEGVSKTQRMKMLGNAVQVQCAQVVGNLLREKVKNG